MLRSMSGVPLLWGLCVLFATSTPGTKSADVAIEANGATEQPTAAAHVKVLHVTDGNPEHRPEDVGAAAPAVRIVSPTVADETSETTVSETTHGSDSTGDGSVVVTAVAAATSSSGLLASAEALEAPAATSTRGEAKPSTNVTPATIETQPLATATVARTSMTAATAEVQPSPAVNTATGGPSAAVSTALTETQPSATGTVARTSMTTMAEVQPSPAVNTATGGPSAAVSTALAETQPSAVATTAKDQVQTSPSVTAATGEAPTLSITMTDTSSHTADQLRQSSPSSLIDKASASGATVAASSLQPTSTAGNTSALPSTSSLNTQSGSISHSVNHPTSSSPTSRTFHSTTTELSSTHKSVSTSVTLSSTAEPSETSSTTADSPRSTTGNSTSPAGILFPLRPKRLPGPTTRSAPAATVTPCKPSKNPPNNQTTTQPCSTRSVANQCLIIIASLAALATIFMVSTIVLCAKLSTRNYKVTKRQPATEMMCISALLPEENHTYRRQRNPVSNGVLVFPGGGYSDDEGGDNLTLSSFLPDNDRYV